MSGVYDECNDDVDVGKDDMMQPDVSYSPADVSDDQSVTESSTCDTEKSRSATEDGIVEVGGRLAFF